MSTDSALDQDFQRLTLQFTVGEIDIDATLTAEEYTSIDFITRNLDLAKDYERDGTYSIHTRRKIAELGSMQIGYYVYCAMRICLLTCEAPSILIFGAGFMGSKVIKDLISVGCGPYIKLYTRGDDDLGYWRDQGIKVNTNLKKLYPSHARKPDIVILCTPMASYPVIVKQVGHLITKSTMLLYITLGLQRRRVYNTFKCPTVLGTYNEPEFLNRALKAQHESGINPDGTSFISASVCRKSEGYVEEDNGDVMTYEQLAAEIIANRAIDIRNLVYIIENYYALNGMNHPMARYEALISVFSYNDVEYESHLASTHGSISLLDKRISASQSDNTDIEDEDWVKSRAQLKLVITNLSNWVGATFQRQFSKHIKIVNLPRASHVLDRIEKAASILQDGNESVIRSIHSNNTLEKYIKQGRRSSKLLDYGAGFELHSDKFINKLYDQDRKYQDPGVEDSDSDEGSDDENLKQLDDISSVGDNYLDQIDHITSVAEQNTKLHIKELIEDESRLAREENNHAWLMSTVDKLLASDQHDIDFNELYSDTMSDV